MRVYDDIGPSFPDYREYIATPLSAPLKACHTYEVSFWVSVGDDVSEYYIQDLGAFLQQGPISGPSGLPIPVVPQVVHSGGVLQGPLGCDTGWTQIRGQFVAAGGEDHVCLGNFLDNVSTTAVAFPGAFPPGVCFYFIDDVSVQEVIDCSRSHTFTCIGGCLDNFVTGNGLESATPNAMTAAALAGCPIAGSFDVPVVDSCFVHKLAECWPRCTTSSCDQPDCGVVLGATLQLLLKAGPPGSGTDQPDTISLWNNSTLLWSQDISVLNGGTWIPGTSQVILLDLADLPLDPSTGATQVLASLYDGELTVVVSDDTSVDWMRAFVVVCECDDAFSDTHEFEQYDGFSGPTLADPRPELISAALSLGASIFPSPPSYDWVPPNCGWFADTISTAGVACLQSAYLEIGIHPTCAIDNLSSDWLHLGLTDECGTLAFAWSQSLQSLLATGHLSPPPTLGTTSIIRLHLDALPPDSSGVTNIMRMVYEGRLDILVGDGFGVDAIVFAPVSCAGTRLTQGLGDIDGDGLVNASDLGALLAAWGGSNPEIDFDGSGLVDGGDLGVLLAHWSG